MPGRVLNEYWGVRADVYAWDEKNGERLIPHWVGLEGEKRIIIFEESITGKTMVFYDKVASQYWCDTHNEYHGLNCNGYYPQSFGGGNEGL